MFLRFYPKASYQSVSTRKWRLTSSLSSFGKPRNRKGICIFLLRIRETRLRIFPLENLFESLFTKVTSDPVNFLPRSLDGTVFVNGLGLEDDRGDMYAHTE